MCNHCQPQNLTVDVLDNDKLHVDFKPLFECIHIYSALDSLSELQKSYQADRKVRWLHDWYEHQIPYRHCITGSIRPHSSNASAAGVPPNSDSRDFRILHCRVSRIGNDWLISVFARCRGTMGNGRCCSNHSYRKRSAYRNGCRKLFKGQRKPFNVYNDAWGRC